MQKLWILLTTFPFFLGAMERGGAQVPTLHVELFPLCLAGQMLLGHSVSCGVAGGEQHSNGFIVPVTIEKGVVLGRYYAGDEKKNSSLNESGDLPPSDNNASSTVALVSLTGCSGEVRLDLAHWQNQGIRQVHIRTLKKTK